jgi:cell division protein FtsB
MKKLNLFIRNQNVLIFLTVFAIMFSLVCYKPIRNLDDKLQEQHRSIEYRTDKKEDNIRKLELLKDEEYKLQQAREQYKFSLDDEILFEIPDELDE